MARRSGTARYENDNNRTEERIGEKKPGLCFFAEKAMVTGGVNRGIGRIE